MDDQRLGLIVRALRRRLSWTQRELARRGNVSQSLVSLVERGHSGKVSTDRLRGILAELDARLEHDVRWRGGQLDRIVDEAHARLVEAAAVRFGGAGWTVRLEVTYAVYSERGSIDLLAFHGAHGAALVVEVKSELTSVEATLRKLDEKVRLAPRIATDRFGWRIRHVTPVLVLLEATSNRRRFARHGRVLGAALPHGARELARWARDPDRPTAGRVFLRPSNPGGHKRVMGGPQRIRTPRKGRAS